MREVKMNGKPRPQDLAHSYEVAAFYVEYAVFLQLRLKFMLIEPFS